MNLSDWKKKYYPIPAAKAASDDLTAAKHSLRKWQGASPAVLKRYHLISRKVYNGAIIREQDNFRRYFFFGAHSCALCHRCPVACRDCPGTLANGGKPCCMQAPYPDSSLPAPYTVFVETGDVKPMLAWLRNVIKLAHRNQAREKKA